jgi:hypothetical protein
MRCYYAVNDCDLFVAFIYNGLYVARVAGCGYIFAYMSTAVELQNLPS